MTQQEFVASLNETDIMSVYSGVNGKCCCGCSGKHTTNPLYQALRSEERGYQVDDDECSAKKVKAILNKIKKNVEDVTSDWQVGKFISVVIGQRPTDEVRGRHGLFRRHEHRGRLYIAYLVPTDEEIAANRRRRADNKVKAQIVAAADRLAKVAAFQGAGI